MGRSRIPRRYQEPTVYEIGKDISQEDYNLAVQRIGDWFSQIRSTREPVLLARQTLDRCLKGVTAKGQPWWTAARMSLNGRVRAMCNFDLKTMQPILSSSEKQKRKRERDKKSAKTRREREKQTENKLLTDEVRQELRRQGITYGQEVTTLLTYEEEKKWKKWHADYVRDFPWLDSASSRAELGQLCDLLIMQERMRMDRVSGKRRVDQKDAIELVDEMYKLKKTLGILPEQLAKRVSESTDSVTIGMAAAKLDPNQGMDYRAVRQEAFKQEVLQIFQMFHTRRADGKGYQLDEPGLFALTRCRTCECAGCGHRNVAGFLESELREYLVNEGLLEPEVLDDAGTQATSEGRGSSGDSQQDSTGEAAGVSEAVETADRVSGTAGYRDSDSGGDVSPPTSADDAVHGASGIE